MVSPGAPQCMAASHAPTTHLLRLAGVKGGEKVRRIGHVLVQRRELDGGLVKASRQLGPRQLFAQPCQVRLHLCEGRGWWVVAGLCLLVRVTRDECHQRRRPMTWIKMQTGTLDKAEQHSAAALSSLGARRVAMPHVFRTATSHPCSDSHFFPGPRAILPLTATTSALLWKSAATWRAHIPAISRLMVASKTSTDSLGSARWLSSWGSSRAKESRGQRRGWREEGRVVGVERGLGASGHVERLAAKSTSAVERETVRVGGRRWVERETLREKADSRIGIGVGWNEREVGRRLEGGWKEWW